MNIRRNQAPPNEVETPSPTGPSRGRHGGWALAGVVAAVVLAGAAFPRQQPQTPTGSGGSNPIPQAKSVPDATAQSKAPEEKPLQQTGDATSPDPNRQFAQDSAKLLELATDLKAEVDKTNKDTLSLRVVRKAEELERFAHNVRTRMKPAVPAN